MNALQKKMLDMLFEIDEICSKHGIEYCLFAGSGLGADRHGGFIPWDDDVDIAMTLENYEKLLKVFDAEAKNGRVLNCLEKSMQYPFTYARYVDTTTTAIQRHTAFGGCDPGIKVDIFIFVPTHSDQKKAEEHRLKILAFSEVICPYVTQYEHRPEGFIEAYREEKVLFDKLGREKYIKKRLPKLKKYKKNNTGKYVLLSGMMCNSYIIDADIMDEIEYVDFEDIKLPISKHNVKFSKELYGEGWISKPKEVDVPHHTYLLDAGRPYSEYIDLLWDVYDFNDAEQTVSGRRNAHIFERDNFKDVFINNQRLRNLAVKMSADNAYEHHKDEIKDSWIELYDLFSNYYSSQLKRINKDYDLFIDLDEKTFETAMNAAVMTNRYFEAADILAIGIRSGMRGYSKQTMSAIKYRIDTCREITETMYIEKDFKKLKKILDGITDELLKNSLTVVIAELWISIAEAGNVADIAEHICDKADKYTDTYGEPGELLAVKGYCLEKCGLTEQAANAYESAASNVRNGYIYQWLADKGYSTYEHKYE